MLCKATLLLCDFGVTWQKRNSGGKPSVLNGEWNSMILKWRYNNTCLLLVCQPQPDNSDIFRFCWKQSGGRSLTCFIVTFWRRSSCLSKRPWCVSATHCSRHLTTLWRWSTTSTKVGFQKKKALSEIIWYIGFVPHSIWFDKYIVDPTFGHFIPIIWR